MKIIRTSEEKLVNEIEIVKLDLYFYIVCMYVHHI